MNTYAGKFTSLGGAVLLAAKHSSSGERLMRSAYVLALLVSDTVMMGLAFRLAFWIRFDLKFTLHPEVVPSLFYYTQLALIITVLCLFMFALSGLYNWHNLAGTVEYSRAFNAMTIAIAVVIFATFVFPNMILSRVWMLVSWPLCVTLVGIGRFSLRRVLYAFRKKGYFQVPVAIVGTNSESLALANELRNPRSGYRVLGLLQLRRHGDGPVRRVLDTPLPLLGSLDELEDVVQNFGIKEIIVAASSVSREDLFDLYERVHGSEDLELRLSTGLFELLTTGVQVRTAGLVPLIGMRKMRLDTSELIIKTVAEYLLTIIGLIFALPLMAVIAVAVKLDSPGPVIHRRRVLGVSGKEFDAYKFRSMYVNGDEILKDHPELAARLEQEQKLQKDPRITRVGHWLRKFSLDELPQLFNVLRGEMSLVGPRMISPPEAMKYGRNRYNLLTVKPGITGLWQVSGRSDIAYDERIKLDMYYIRNYSIWLDFHLLFIKTANAVLRGRGAY